MAKFITEHHRELIGLGLSAFGVAAWMAACSGGSSNDTTNPASSGGTAGADSGATTSSGGNAGTGGSAGDSVDAGTGGSAGGSVDAGSTSSDASCASPTLRILFSPMYSAYIPGSTAHTFSIPAVTADGKRATWRLSDASQGHLQAQDFQVNGASVPGVLITVAGTGDSNGEVTIVADEGNGVCGTSVLHVTQNTEDDWSVGNARYNNGVSLVFRAPGNDGGPPPGRDGGNAGVPSADAQSFFESEGGTACTNCHGPTATSGPFKTVSHTPEQIGGFSDTDLKNIIWNGVVPDGGYFDPSVLVAGCDGGTSCTETARTLWHAFHRWTDISAEQLPGIISYLRSLTPQAQAGVPSFGPPSGGGPGAASGNDQ